MEINKEGEKVSWALFADSWDSERIYWWGDWGISVPENITRAPLPPCKGCSPECVWEGQLQMGKESCFSWSMNEIFTIDQRQGGVIPNNHFSVIS